MRIPWGVLINVNGVVVILYVDEGLSSSSPGAALFDVPGVP